MKKYKLIYSSIGAYYNLGTYYANSKEEAEKECREYANAFTPSREEK